MSDTEQAIARLREQTVAAFEGSLPVGAQDLALIRAPEPSPGPSPRCRHPLARALETVFERELEPEGPALLDLDQTVSTFAERYQLTWREREVLRQVLLGRSNAAVARALRIALRTAKTHVEHIWEKMGIHSRAQLMGRLFLEPRP